MGSLNGRAFVTYYRVSTKGQALEGWGLPAQRDAVAAFVARHRGTIVSEHQDVESGGKTSRPGLTAAIAAAQAHRAVLLVAKLDRLTRSLSLLAMLREARVEFVAADQPEANDLTVSILVAVAQDELSRISARTKAGLAAAKARGVTLGSPRNLTDAARQRAVQAHRRAAMARHAAGNLRALLRSLRAQGLSLRAIARHLVQEGVRTPSGSGTWSAASVGRVLKFYERANS